jgi:hypothetical protein
MYVSVHHTINDPASFHTRGLKLRQVGPDGMAPVQLLPDGQGHRATCLWQGASLDAVRDHIDGTLGDSSDQEYFAVSEERAFGLPVGQPV